jgi:hypothetical protein
MRLLNDYGMLETFSLGLLQPEVMNPEQERLDESPYHFVGSLSPFQHPDLLKVPQSRFRALAGEDPYVAVVGNDINAKTFYLSPKYTQFLYDQLSFFVPTTQEGFTARNPIMQPEVCDTQGIGSGPLKNQAPFTNFNTTYDIVANLTSRLLLKLRDQGKGILLISAELDEIMSLSDRILVLYEGEIIADGREFSEKEMGLLMAGQKKGA